MFLAIFRKSVVRLNVRLILRLLILLTRRNLLTWLVIFRYAIYSFDVALYSFSPSHSRFRSHSLSLLPPPDELEALQKTYAAEQEKLTELETRYAVLERECCFFFSFSFFFRKDQTVWASTSRFPDVS